MSGRAIPPPPTAPRASVDQQLASPGVTRAQRDAVTLLAERLQGHVLRTIHRDALFQIEQCVWSEIDQIGLADDEGDLATALIAEALFRIGHSPERNINDVPAGITDVEQIAAAFDEDCLMCLHEMRDADERMSGKRCEDLHARFEDKEWLELNRQAARAWRAQHAEALRKFDLE